MTQITGEGGPAHRHALSRLIGVSASEFADDYWATKPLLTAADGQARASGPGQEHPLSVGSQRYDDLFSADAVDELIARRGIRTPFIRMANEGQVLPAIRFTGSGGFGAEVGDQVDSAKVFAEFAGGSTIVLQGLHRTWAPLADFTRQLVADIGHPCQVNAYVTPAQSRGFDPHYDVHDVFVIQIAGHKRWRIHEPALVDPLPNEPWSRVREKVERQASGTPALDETLSPGDVLYLPRGWIHSATALGSTSVHVTIGVAALTRRDLVDLLLESIDIERLRSSLPLGAGTADADALAPEVADTIAALTSALSGPAVLAATADRVRGRVGGSTRAEPIDPLKTTDAVAALDSHSVVRWRLGQSTTLEDTPDSVILRRADTDLNFPREAASALATLARGDSISVGALPDLDESSAIVVARRLLREGVLIVALAPSSQLYTTEGGS